MNSFDQAASGDILAFILMADFADKKEEPEKVVPPAAAEDEDGDDEGDEAVVRD